MLCFGDSPEGQLKEMDKKKKKMDKLGKLICNIYDKENIIFSM